MQVLMRGDLGQRLRLASGLVLLVFAATHFLNHALGLVGLEAMLEMQAWRKAVTRSLPGSLILLAAILVHAGLGLVKLARRATLSMPVWEAVQIGSGLLIPVWLIQHVTTNRGAALLAGTDDSYRYELANLWPAFAWDQSLLLAIVWTHACIGLHFWLRLTPGWRRLQGIALAIAVAVPLLALAGFSVASRQMAEALTVPGAWESLMREARAPSPEQAALLVSVKWWLQGGFVLAAALAVAMPLLRGPLARLAAGVRIDYRAGPTVRAAVGPTLLEISRMHGVPHTAVCGGRGRCSTCRVRVAEALAELPPPSPAESAVLRSVGAVGDVRLACQLRPPCDIAVERLVAAGSAVGARRGLEGADAGIERTLAVLFFDLRGFTQLTERSLPYDVVHLLNRVFAVAAAAISESGGRIDKYIGDGVMAVFGEAVEPDEACRQAVRAARQLDLALEALCGTLTAETGAPPLTCAIGLHVGPLVLGRIGDAASAQLTVIGRTVNAAARLESVAKEAGCQLAVSRQVLRRAGVPLDGLVTRRIEIRGLTSPLNVVLVPRARELRV